MKKIISTYLVIIMFAIFMPLMPAATVAASPPVPVTVGETAEVGGGCPAGTYRVRGHTRTKKKVVNSLIAGGVGAAIGGGLGGKRGALLGAGTGAGGYLTYRYIKDRRGRCVRSYRRR